MAKRKNPVETAQTSSATVGYEAQLWQMADALRGSMNTAEYKHVVLGLIFLKYISDAFEEHPAASRPNVLRARTPRTPTCLRPADRQEARGKHLREGKRWKYSVPLAFVMYRPFWRKD